MGKGNIWRKPVDNSGEWGECTGVVAQIALHHGSSVRSPSGYQLLWGRNHDEEIYHAVCPPGGSARLAWNKVRGACVQLDVSHRWVFTVNSADEVYRKSVDNASEWEKTDALLKGITVTNSGYVWGVNSSQDIYFARADAPASSMGFEQVSGKGVQVSASNKWVYHVNADEEFYRKAADNSTEWEKTDALLKCITVTDSGYVWGVNSSQEIYFARADAPADSMGFEQVSGEAVQVHASGGWVYHVNEKGNIWRKPV